jgi:hypothetical protein
MSEEAGVYFNESENRGNELLEKYDNEIPASIEQDYYDSIDKDKISELSADLMSTVDNFYMNALK